MPALRVAVPSASASLASVRRRRWTPWRAGAFLAGAAALLAGCSSGGTVAGTGASPPLSVDRSARTVHLLLVAAANGVNGGFNFDGAAKGAMTVTVPAGWRVEVTCENASTTLTHSCAVVTASGRLAFPGASVANATEGLAPGGEGSFSFVAARPGAYRVACLVPGHEIAGMWDRLVVTAGGKPAIEGARAT